MKTAINDAVQSYITRTELNLNRVKALDLDLVETAQQAIYDEIRLKLGEVPDRWAEALAKEPAISFRSDGKVWLRNYRLGGPEDYYLAVKWLRKGQTICDEGAQLRPYCLDELCLEIVRTGPDFHQEFVVSFHPPPKVRSKLIDKGLLHAGEPVPYWSYQCKVSS